MKKLSFICFFVLIFSFQAFTQHTIGLLSYEPTKTFEGYNLLYPHHQQKVFLLNNCGEIVHVWEDDVDFRPGNTAYVLDNGNLLKTKRYNLSNIDPIWAGGGGAFVEILDWENNLLWSFEQNDSLRRLHHDIAPMPNGNILMISWELKTGEEVFQAGLNPALMPEQGELWPDYILEVDPSLDSVVWEWHAWDHLVQDFDQEKDNYGTVEEHPELIDINWEPNNIVPDWMHSNSIDYNEELDQIVLCVPKFHEAWIIDHSTTTEEAVGHSGGLGGRGGDLLYRWGNPATYKLGTNVDKKLFFPHDIHWVDDFVDSSYAHYGKLAVFNNRANPNYSTVNIFSTPFDKDDWAYLLGSNMVWGPTEFDLTITHPDPVLLHSTSISGVQFLPNGNSLICSGRTGFTFELTPTNEIVWEFVTPLNGGSPAVQGESPANNQTFRVERYPIDYIGFEGKDLSPKGYIELNPDTTYCDMILPVSDIYFSDQLKIYPNPANERLTIDWQGIGKATVEVIDLPGKKVMEFEISRGCRNLNITDLQKGIYFVRVNGVQVRKLLVH
ncbi:MAG: T9SS type A sorting domain-containing protein [Bacteroidetes bacterium]|nr:T9SS type A sorting domain-containing protein [Bacteroidota bacterium]